MEIGGKLSSSPPTYLSIDVIFEGGTKYFP
jgi:hypothetical protein